MVMNGIIRKIQSRQLPLSPAELKKTKDFCSRQREQGQLQVLTDGLPEILYKDWIDQALDPVRRAHEHINADPREWWDNLLKMCRLGVNAHLQSDGHVHCPAGLQIWRGAWPFLVPLAENELDIAHMQTKRHADLTMSLPMPLSRSGLTVLKRSERIIVTDIMVAAGTSLNYSLGQLAQYGIPHSKISVVCVAAAPEGVYLLQTLNPELRITTVSLHGYLNAQAYIEGTGLGDAGRKVLEALIAAFGNAMNFFIPYAKLFSQAEWERLQELVQPKNHALY